MAEPARARLSLADEAAVLLREEILAGSLHPGDRVHLESTASRFEMSPIPVREALRMLASEGLVIPIPQRGYRVTAATVDDLDDTYRLRVVLDPLAVRLAVVNFDEDARADLQACFDALVKSYEQPEWRQHRVPHRNFHFAIYARCGSPWLLRFISMLWENSDRYQKLSTAGRGSPAQRLEEHRGIMEATIAGDSEEAARRMEDHLRLTYRTVRALLAEAPAAGNGAGP
jgi:DNA-binding GntR family transcriptional regulator